MRVRVVAAALAAGQCLAADAQVAPGESELKRYTGLHRAAAYGDVGRIKPGDVDARDGYGRTPLHVAAFRAQHAAAGAPLDHVNNLGWTALMESIVLGNGGARHTETLNALLDAGADPNIADRGGVTPLAHARARGYGGMVRLLQAKNAR